MYRVWYAARMKSGMIQRECPRSTWDQLPLAHFLSDKSLSDPERYDAYRTGSAPQFFFNSRDRSRFQSLLAQWDTAEQSPLVASAEIHRGVFRFFSHEPVNVGIPPKWNCDPVSHHEFPVDRHWSQIGDFAAGDIKLVWETNRFGFVYPLVRSYWRTGNEQDAELFWQLIESWCDSNPPQSGPNWKCGQEISLRLMAWCFGLYGFASSPSSTPLRVTKLAQAIAVSATRIEANIGYALSQQNNHGLSEAMGLWTAGTLFPEFSNAKRWEARGRALLEKQAIELIYDDGAFSQHSMNYHRVMLHDYLWVLRLGDVLGQPFSDKLRDRIAKASNFVYQLQDDATGHVPCYGQDDGALILPLSNCDYRDYRPVVQASHYVATGEHRLKPGPWDEDLFWLFGADACTPFKADQHQEQISTGPHFRCTDSADLSPRRTRFEAPIGGYAVLRAESGFAVTRAAKFRHRPAQADSLHIDLWWRGQNIAIDPGTYSYNAPAPWNNPFAHTAHHNTVVVDGRDQMERASRFIWLPWLNGQSFSTHVPIQGDASCWNGEHDGYRRLHDPVTHRRGLVRLGSDHWLVIDALWGQQDHAYRLHWLLHDTPVHADAVEQSLELETAAGTYRVAMTSTELQATFEIKRAEPDSARGWRSNYYHSREPALSVSLESTTPHVVFATMFGPHAQTPIIEPDRVLLATDTWSASIALNRLDRSGEPLIHSIVLNPSPAKSRANRDNQPSLSKAESSPCTYC